MPERFEIYIVYKRRYINTLPFLSFPLILQCDTKEQIEPTLFHQLTNIAHRHWCSGAII